MDSTGEIGVRQPPSAAVASRIKPDTIQKAVNALIKWKDSQSKSQKAQLLGEDEFVYLVLTMKKIPPQDRTNAYKIPLPHSLFDNSAAAEFCLIIDDRDRSKSRLTSEDAKKKVKDDGVPISKVLKISKLKTDYRPFEAKRKLCDSFDMFFADKRVIPLLPRMLGNQFFKKKKLPVPVELTHKNWKEQIERICSSALLYMKTGTCSVLKVAKTSMEPEEIVENVIAAIDGVAEIVPKKWKGIRSLHLKLSESLALPIYQVIPDMPMKIEVAKRTEEKTSIKEESEVEGDNSESDLKESDKKKNRGRIHDVQYMDDGELALSEDDDDAEDLRNNDDDDVEEEEEAAGKKKRKQKNVKDPSKLKGGKRIKKLPVEATAAAATVGEEDKKTKGKDSSAKKTKKKSLSVKDKKVKTKCCDH